MGLMDRFTGFSQTVIPKEVVIALTPLGEEKVDSGMDDKVMITLRERGPCPVEELSKYTGFSIEKLKYIVNKQLAPKGYVRRVN